MPTTSVGVIVLSEDRKTVLLQKREDFRIWGIPAGGLENGETREEAGKREALEETGYIVEIDGFFGEYWRPQLKHGGDTMYVYTGHVTGGSPDDRGWESVEVGWFKFDQLPEKMTRFARQYLTDLVNCTPPVKKTLLVPWWYITLLRIGFFFRDIRNRILGRT